MSFARRAVLALAAVLSLPATALAVPIVDFSDLSLTGNVTNLGASATLGGVTAYAYYVDVNGTLQPSVLIARDENNDHGLGVCSEGVGNCSIGGTGDGDDNELSQLDYFELIVLEKPADKVWTGVWLSSLDGNDGSTSQGNEDGILYWGNTLFTAFGFTGFSYPDAFGVGVVEGSLTLPGSFDNTARYLYFLPGGSVGDNNDYLVWGVDIRDGDFDTPVPEPASLLLLGTGLVAVARSRRRSRR